MPVYLNFTPVLTNIACRDLRNLTMAVAVPATPPHTATSNFPFLNIFFSLALKISLRDLFLRKIQKFKEYNLVKIYNFW